MYILLAGLLLSRQPSQMKDKDAFLRTIYTPSVPQLSVLLLHVTGWVVGGGRGPGFNEMRGPPPAG